MITIGSNGQNIAYGIKHYNIDSMDDLAKLNPKAEMMGTTCFVIKTSKYYMVNGEKKWVEITPFGKSSSSGSGDGESDNFPWVDEDGDGIIDLNYDGGEIK